MSDTDTVVVKPIGDVDSTTAPVLKRRLDLAADSGQTRIVLDLGHSDFISSSGVGLMLGQLGELRDAGGDLILMNLPMTLVDVFDLMSIDDYFCIIDDLDELAEKGR